MFVESYPVLFFVLIPLVSFLYSTVGHGGASGYLALMALFSFPTLMMKQTALLLNLFVAGIAFYHYFKAGYFNKKLFLNNPKVFSFMISGVRAVLVPSCTPTNAV